MNVNGCHIHKPTTTFHSTAPISFPIAHPRKDQSPLFSSGLHSNKATPVSIGDSTELSIFTTERYFNDYNNNNNAATKRVVAERSDLYTTDSSVSSMEGYGYGYGRNCRNEASVQFRVTPTSPSEASGNSQTGLLANPPGFASVTFRALPHAEQRKGSSSSACRWLFGWSCPCSGKRSVEVEKRFQGPKTSNHSNCDSGPDGSSGVLRKQSNATIVASENKPVLAKMTNLKLISTTPHDFQTAKTNLYSPETHYPSRIGHGIVASGVPFADTGSFSFPILTKPALDADPPRDSLEVFRPKDDTTNMPKSLEFDRWKPPADTNRLNFAFPGSPRVVADDDVLSDSSSDLFEIESFSTQMTSGTAYRGRDSLDEILAMDPRRFVESAAGILQLRHGVEEPTRPSNVPSECYPPSEVSVQWSVTTAEGFDRGSVANFSRAASEYEEAVAFVPVPERNGVGSGGGGGKKRGGVLSCRREKAVSVHGPLPVKHVAEQRKGVENGVVSSTMRVWNGGGGGRSSERPPLARSHSARLNRPIQTRRSTCG